MTTFSATDVSEETKFHPWPNGPFFLVREDSGTGVHKPFVRGNERIKIFSQQLHKIGWW